MKELFLVRGLPGAGKSKLAKSIAGSNGYVKEDDMYFVDGDGNYRFNPKEIKLAHDWCLEEVDFIMKLPTEFFPLEIDELKANNVRIRMMGTMEGVPEHTQQAVNMAIAETNQNTGLILNIAMNYGGRSELLLGIKQFTEDVMLGKRRIEELSEQTFATYLQSQELPVLDLLIRTSGEIRISNFMLWQLAYTELWFTDVYWPEFTEQHFYEAIRSYQNRARRYGKI
jgi:undecaprenyl diphosphate synthase